MVGYEMPECLAISSCDQPNRAALRLSAIRCRQRGSAERVPLGDLNQEQHQQGNDHYRKYERYPPLPGYFKLHRFLSSLTPALPPFSAMKSTPASALLVSLRISEQVPPRYRRRTRWGRCCGT
jgi:hypothetical protein